jgi:hypothetical protein
MQVDFSSDIDKNQATKVLEDTAGLLAIPAQTIEGVIIADRFGDEAIAEVPEQPGAGALTGSWVVFDVALAAFVAVNVVAGEIRPNR